MVILREKKEPDLHQALIILRPSNTSSSQLLFKPSVPFSSLFAREKV
jgi:hypothetical protein